MSLFGDEYYLGETSPWWEEIAIVAFGIVLGAGLSEYFSWRRRISERKEVGELFKIGLDGLKVPLSLQIQSIKDYIQSFKQPSLGVVSFSIFNNNIDYLKNLDRYKVIKHFGKSNARVISTKFNAIYNIEETTKDVMAELIFISKEYANYKIEFAKTIENLKVLISFNHTLQKGSSDPDPFTMQLYEITSKIQLVSSSTVNLLRYEKIIIEPIEELCKSFPEGKDSLEAHGYIINAKNIIGRSKDFLRTRVEPLDVMRTSIESCYDAIYVEEISKI